MSFCACRSHRSWVWSVNRPPSWPASVMRGVRSSSTPACPSPRSSRQKWVLEEPWGCSGSSGGQNLELLSTNFSRQTRAYTEPRCRLPRYACQFIEMCLMVTADHGPAVSGAHNTIVCARAGKDLISSLTSGLLTIVSSCTRSRVWWSHTSYFEFVCQGDRFGGALDAAAKQFSKAFDSGMLAMEFVNKMKKDGKLIMGIGHRVKSVSRSAVQCNKTV